MCLFCFFTFVFRKSFQNRPRVHAVVHPEWWVRSAAAVYNGWLLLSVTWTQTAIKIAQLFEENSTAWSDDVSLETWHILGKITKSPFVNEFVAVSFQKKPHCVLRAGKDAFSFFFFLVEHNFTNIWVFLSPKTQTKMTKLFFFCQVKWMFIDI